MWIDPADAFDVRVGKQILVLQQGGAFRQEHGGADEALFRGIVEFAVRFENAFIDAAVVASGRKSRHEACVGDGDETIDAFTAQVAFQNIDGQMVAVRDGHDGHVVF